VAIHTVVRMRNSKKCKNGLPHRLRTVFSPLRRMKYTRNDRINKGYCVVAITLFLSMDLIDFAALSHDFISFSL